MSYYCSDCENFKTKKQKYPGCCNCSKLKKDVWACQDACDKFSFDFSRNSSTRKDLHATACKEIKKDRSKITGFQLFWMFILFFMIWLYAKISGV